MSNETNEVKDIEQTQPDSPPTETVADERSEEEKLREQYRLMGEELDDETSISEVLDKLSTFQEEEKKEKRIARADRHVAARKRKLLILLLVVVAAAGLCVYWFALRDTGTTSGTSSTVAYTEKDILPATAAEKAAGKCEYVSSSLLYLFAPLEKAEVASIAWHNEKGDFSFYRNDEDAFVVKGAENNSYDEDLFSVLLVATTRNPAVKRVKTDVTDFSEYGLENTDDCMSFTVTTKAGVSHTVYLGTKTPSDAGYYARYEDRPAVYILDAKYLGATVTQDAATMLTPLLVYPVPENQYYQMDHFILAHDGEPMMKVDFLDEGQRETLATTRLFKMTYPADYTLSVERYDTAVLQALTQLTGSYVVSFKPDDTALEQYGCLHPAHEIWYEYDGVTVYLMISQKNTDETYYVYSPLMSVIAVVSADQLQFLEWDLITFIERPIFSRDIGEIDKISVKTADGSTDAVFDLTHYPDVENKDEKLDVTELNSGKEITDIKNFRNFYRVLLSTDIQDYAPYTGKDADSLKLGLTLTVTTAAGVDVTYRFYPYSTGRVLYTINGQGEFYIRRKSMDKLVSDCNKVLTGQTVDADAKQ